MIHRFSAICPSLLFIYTVTHEKILKVLYIYIICMYITPLFRFGEVKYHVKRFLFLVSMLTHTNPKQPNTELTSN